MTSKRNDCDCEDREDRPARGMIVTVRRDQQRGQTSKRNDCDCEDRVTSKRNDCDCEDRETSKRNDCKRNDCVRTE